MAEIGYATLGIIPSFDGFERKLTGGVNGPMGTVGGRAGGVFGDAAGKTAGSRFGSVFKKAATAGLVGIGALGVGAFKLAKDSIAAASDLEESTNKVNQVFGDAAGKILKFSGTAADALGQTNVQARDAAATFGLFGSIAGLNDRKTAGFAKRMTVLASDLASFHNTEPDQAVEALGAALRGESEPIRSYGVLLDEAALKAEALRLGLIEPTKDAAKIKSYQIALIEKQRDYNEAVAEHGKASFEAEKAEASLGTTRELLQKATEGTIEPLTQQQKVLAASSAIFRQTKVAQGDFARTSDGLANQQRRLKARFEDAKAELGQGLLPIMTDAADFVLDKGLPAFEKFSGWFTDEGVPAIKDFTRDNLPEIKKALRTVKDVAEDVAPVLKDMFEGFNDLPDGLKKAIVLGAGGALVAKKTGLLGTLTGGSKGLAGLVTAAKPMPVFVTNPGFGGAGGGLPGAGGKPTAPTGKTSVARSAGRAVLPIALLDAIYETTAGDLYGLDPKSKNPRDDLSPIVRTGGGAFGIGLNHDPDALGGKKLTDRSVRLFNGVVDSTEKAGDAVDTLGIRIGAMVNTSKARAGTLDDKLDLIGSKKLRPEVDLGSIDRAQGRVDHLYNSLRRLAGDASGGIDAAGQTVIDAVTGRDQHRNRRRNLGGFGPT